MKNFFVSYILFIVMCIFLFLASKYVILTCDKMLDTSMKIEQHILNDEWDDSYILSFKLLHIYEGHVNNLNLFLNHSEFDSIYRQVIMLTQYAKCNNKDESLATIHMIKTMIHDVKTIEYVNIRNIL